MNVKHSFPLALVALLAVSTAGVLAHAETRDNDTRDTAALATMKVTLQQAIATAEQQAGGRAVGADVSQQGGTTRISVEIGGPQGVKTVMVDGQSGQVTATHDSGGNTEDND
jgi:uncharacterized membrane protein YkoI